LCCHWPTRLLTVFILQFQGLWNDFLAPLLYLNPSPSRMPAEVRLSEISTTMATSTYLIVNLNETPSLLAQRSQERQPLVRVKIDRDAIEIAAPSARA